MANLKVSDLSTITPSLSDVIYVVDDPGGIPVSSKCDFSAVAILLTNNNFPKTNIVNQWTAPQTVQITTIPYTATYTPVMSTLSVGTVTLSGDMTLNIPDVILPGGGFSIIFRQDATGGHGLTFDNSYLFDSGGTAHTLTLSANAIDILQCVAISDSEIYAFILNDIQ